MLEVESRGRFLDGHRPLDRDRLWRLPAVLSALGVPALFSTALIRDLTLEGFAWKALAVCLSVSTCCMLLGLGLGIWIALRVRSRRSLIVAAWAVAVATAWWIVIHEPSVRHRVPDRSGVARTSGGDRARRVPPAGPRP